MINSLIVENEKTNYEYLEAMLKRHFPEINILEIVEDIPSAIDKTKEYNPDLIFLDIELPPYTGFNLLEETRGLNYHTIFTTSFNQYATKAFKFSAVHYLEKPFGLPDLKEAIQFYKERVDYSDETGVKLKVDTVGKKAEDALIKNSNASGGDQIVGFPVLAGIDFVSLKEVIWCKADNNYTELRLGEKKKKVVTKNLSWLESLLPDDMFYRTHNSYMVNKTHIKQYLKGDGGEVVMSDGYPVDVARNRKKAFLNWLRKLGSIKD